MKSNMLSKGGVALAALALAATAANAAAIKGELSTPLGGARVYIAPMNGFENFLSAAILRKHVPVEIVTDPAQAEFEITGSAESQKAGWAKIVFASSIHSSEEASIVVRNLKTGEVVYAYAVNKSNSAHGKQSSAEACAKHLKQAIEKEI